MFLSVFLWAAAANTVVPSICNESHLNPNSLQNVAIVELPPPAAPPPRTNQSQNGTNPFALKGSTPNETNPLELNNPPLASGGEVLGYTRLRIKYTSCATAQSRRYAEESRSAIERFFVGKVDNHVLKIDAVIEPLGVKASSQLYSMLRNSKKDGQSWTTEVRNNDYLLPYFRLDSASILNFSANFQSEGSSDVGVGSALLEIVERGSKFIAPSAILITDENKPRFNDAATFVDDSLSKLFYKKVTETARQGIAIKADSNEQLLTRILLLAPHPTRTYVTDQAPGRIIGLWEIVADPLKKSLFAEVGNDNLADLAKLDPATVLNFKIGDKEVLRDRLSSSEAIGRAAQQLAKASDTGVGEPAIVVCRLVAMEAARVGLAPYDMAIAAWAFLEDQGMAGTKAQNARQACQPVTRSLKLP